MLFRCGVGVVSARVSWFTHLPRVVQCLHGTGLLESTACCPRSGPGCSCHWRLADSSCSGAEVANGLSRALCSTVTRWTIYKLLPVLQGRPLMMTRDVPVLCQKRYDDVRLLRFLLVLCCGRWGACVVVTINTNRVVFNVPAALWSLIYIVLSPAHLFAWLLANFTQSVTINKCAFHIKYVAHFCDGSMCNWHHTIGNVPPPSIFACLLGAATTAIVMFRYSVMGINRHVIGLCFTDCDAPDRYVLFVWCHQWSVVTKTQLQVYQYYYYLWKYIMLMHVHTSDIQKF